MAYLINFALEFEIHPIRLCVYFGCKDNKKNEI